MKKLILLTIVALSVAFTCQAKKTELSLHLQQGKAYRQVTDSKINIDQELQGQQMKMVMGIKGSMTYRVTAVTAAGYDMDVQYDSLSMSMQMPMGTANFSSEKNDASDIFSTVLKSMKNRPFQVKMTKRGKITEVKNIDKLFDSIFDQFPQLTEAQKAQVRAQLMQSYGEAAFKGNIEMVTAIYADKPVAPGDSWEIKTRLESGMAADMTTTYTFEKSTSDYDLIVGNSKIATADKDAYIESNGMPLKYDLTGSMSSKIKVDKQTGWIIEASMKQEMQGDAYIKDNPKMPGGMKIPMTMQSEMTFTDK